VITIVEVKKLFRSIRHKVRHDSRLNDILKNDNQDVLTLLNDTLYDLQA